jgi:hypothetical protein
MYDMIYLIAIGLTPCGSSTAHIYTQTIHRIQRTEQKNFKQCSSVYLTDKALSMGMYTTDNKNLIKSTLVGPPRTDSMSSHDSMIRSERASVGMIGQLPRGLPYKGHAADVDWTDVEDSQLQKPKKQSSQIAKELSDMVIYVQVRQNRVVRFLRKCLAWGCTCMSRYGKTESQEC